MALRNGRSVCVDGSAAVIFTVQRSPTSLSDLLGRHFADNGWLPRATQYMNPHLSTSFAPGWRMLPVGVLTLDRVGAPVKREPYRWTGEWENDRGAVVYSLRCEGREIQGYADYVPRSSVDLARTRRGVSCVDIETRAPLAAGQSFTSPIGKGLEFRLTAEDAGVWRITLGLSETWQDYLWVASPPFRTAPHLQIGHGYGLTGIQSAQKSSRAFRFVTTPQEYDATAKLVETAIREASGGLTASGIGPQGKGTLDLWITGAGAPPPATNWPGSVCEAVPASRTDVGR